MCAWHDNEVGDLNDASAYGSEMASAFRVIARMILNDIVIGRLGKIIVMLE